MKKKLKNRILIFVVAGFIAANVVAAFHAYKFTHFVSNNERTKDPKDLSVTEKIGILLTGIDNPRPTNKSVPVQPYTTVNLDSNKMIECWLVEHSQPRGTVILFHGFSGEKSSLLERSDIFHSMGYNTLLVDFMGSGGSEGNQTTIGFHEAQQVKAAVDYVKGRGEDNVVLFGTSMGSAAIMKSIYDFQPKVDSIIIECPFATMLSTVQARFRLMNVPSFPMAQLLVLWGGVENDFNAFSHNPVNYAKRINTRTLLMYGMKDDKVSYHETLDIFNNLGGEKELKTYSNAGHENYLKDYREEWTNDVAEFLR